MNNDMAIEASGLAKSYRDVRVLEEPIRGDVLVDFGKTKRVARAAAAGAAHAALGIDDDVGRANEFFGNERDFARDLT